MGQLDGDLRSVPLFAQLADKRLLGWRADVERSLAAAASIGAGGLNAARRWCDTTCV
jgi:hypothetical protein